MAFTIQDGLDFVKGIQSIQDNRRKLELEQEGKDIDTYAELLGKREKLQDPEAQRQIDTQLSGYSAGVKIRGTVMYRAMLKDEAEALNSKFKIDAAEALPKLKSIDTMIQSGQTREALPLMDDVLNKHLRNGLQYKSTLMEDGKVSTDVFNSKGEKTQTLIRSVKDIQQQASGLASNPGDMYSLWIKENKIRQKDNWESMWNFKTLVGKDGKKILTWWGTPDNGKGQAFFADEKTGTLLNMTQQDLAAGGFKEEKTDKEKLEEGKIAEETRAAKGLADTRETAVGKAKEYDELRVLASKYLDTLEGKNLFLDPDGKVYEFKKNELGEIEKKERPDETRKVRDYADKERKKRKGLDTAKGIMGAITKKKPEVGIDDPGLMEEPEQWKQTDSGVKKSDQKLEDKSEIIAEKHPDWQSVIDSSEFNRFIKDLPKEKQKVINDIIDYGSGEDVAELLTQYKKIKEEESKKKKQKYEMKLNSTRGKSTPNLGLDYPMGTGGL